MKFIRFVLLFCVLFSGCRSFGDNQDDSKPVKIRYLKRGKDGIYRIPRAEPIKLKKEEVIEEELDAKKLAEKARQEALKAKEAYEERRYEKKYITNNFNVNWNLISLYYFTFISVCIVYLILKFRKEK